MALRSDEVLGDAHSAPAANSSPKHDQRSHSPFVRSPFDATSILISRPLPAHFPSLPLEPEPKTLVTREVTAHLSKMPLEEQKPDPPVPLTESPDSVMTNRSESPIQKDLSPTAERLQRQFIIIPAEHQQRKAATDLNLHPYTRPLTISDLESCVALENAAFTNPDERATREKASLPARKMHFWSST